MGPCPQKGRAPADAGATPVEKLEALGVRGILWRLAQHGQIIDVRCEMPQCYRFRGRRYFEPISPGAVGCRRQTTVRGSRCTEVTSPPTTSGWRIGSATQRDSLWRVKINAMIGKRMSLEEIAKQLNVKKVPTIHGTNRWTAASVRKAFVS
jgi:hypothetical protein